MTYHGVYHSYCAVDAQHHYHKLTALTKQRQASDANKQRDLAAVASKSSQSGKLRVILDAFKVHSIEAPKGISTANFRRFHEHSRHDPSIAPSLLRECQLAVEQALEMPSHKYEHASFFGRLVMDWLGNPNDTPASGSASGDPFEHVGHKQMHDERKELESIVFAGEGSKVRPTVVEKYLDKVFNFTTQSKKLLKPPLQNLKEGMKSFELGRFEVENLEDSTKGVLMTDLLSEAKRTALNDFKNNPMILQEMADVLNMQSDALESWSWGEEPIPVEVQRALNGKYRVYMDEEIVQALLLHFIGMKWAVHLKTVLTELFHSGAWKQSSRKSLDRTARDRGQDSGLETREYLNIRNERCDRYQNDYFMVQLPEAFVPLMNTTRWMTVRKAM